eukprot:scaffold27099_cov26-Tisochrysis_lutea.AAC.1
MEACEALKLPAQIEVNGMAGTVLQKGTKGDFFVPVISASSIKFLRRGERSISEGMDEPTNTDKHYPRAWWIRARLRVQIKNGDGTFIDPEITSIGPASAQDSLAAQEGAHAHEHPCHASLGARTETWGKLGRCRRGRCEADPLSFVVHVILRQRHGASLADADAAGVILVLWFSCCSDDTQAGHGEARQMQEGRVQSGCSDFIVQVMLRQRQGASSAARLFFEK